MTRMLFEAGPERIQTDFAPDLKGRTAPLWVDGQNMVMVDGKLRPIPGQKLFPTGESFGAIIGLVSARVGDINSVFWGTPERLYRWTASGGVAQEGSGYTGMENAAGQSPATLWSFERWGSWMVASNGIDKIQVWKTATGDFAQLATSGVPPTRAGIVISRTPHLVALNTNKGGSYAEWSAEDNIEDFVVGVGKSAGNLLIREAKTDIIAARRLGAEIVFYTENSQHLLYYGGAPFRFRHQQLNGGFGCCGKQALVEINGEHYGMDTRQVWKSNGTPGGWKDISTGRVKEWIFGDFNKAQKSKVVIQPVPAWGFLAIYFPSASSTRNDRCAIYDYIRDRWLFPATFARSAADQEPQLDYLLSGNVNGFLFDWSELDAPSSISSPGLLSLPTQSTFFLGWGYGGWGLFPWGGATMVATG